MPFEEAYYRDLMFNGIGADNSAAGRQTVEAKDHCSFVAKQDEGVVQQQLLELAQWG